MIRVEKGPDKKPFVYIILSAALFGSGSPAAKLLLKDIPPVALAGLLYLGAFLGLFPLALLTAAIKPGRDISRLKKGDLPWLAGAVLTGAVLAPIFQMLGLELVSGFSASLLLNLEGAATAAIAVLFFKENAGWRLRLALLCMTAAGAILSWSPDQGRFSPAGPLLILLAVICWGADNNLTRQISDRNPVQIACLKGLAGGVVSLSLALGMGARLRFDLPLLFALVLGSLSYGLSLVFFIKALKGLGASRAGAFFSLGPFIGALASILILGDWAGWVMLPAFLLMAAGIGLILRERHSHFHVHESMTHTHTHKHDDPHHLHSHSHPVVGEHAHEHSHPELGHIHLHWPDSDHRHPR